MRMTMRFLSGKLTIHAFTLSAAALCATGCGAGVETTDSGEAPVGEARQEVSAPTCVTIRRGDAGDVADTKLRGDQPNANFGALSSFVTGDQFTNRLALMSFNLSPIPPGQYLTSATVSLTEISNLGPSTIDVHAATAPWAEGTVTWNSFGAAYAPASEVAFSNGGAGFTGSVSFDLTALTRAWYSGATVNDGVALLAASNSTWASSEAANRSARPALQVCYVPDPCAGIVCPPPDGCHAPSTCDSATGLCSNIVAPDGTACDDGLACTVGDACHAGVCSGSAPGNVLFFSDPCDKPTLGFQSFSETVTISGSGTLQKVWAGIGYWAQGTVYNVTLSTASQTVSYPGLGFSPRMWQGYSPCAPLNNMAGAALPAGFPVTAGEQLTITITGNGGEIHKDGSGHVRMGLEGQAACGG